ncbi:SigE family RNA polymerase sigma factor [Embleya sp. NBC_00896]|uniref:SigE family RNA polymerase sigma factor n=1 Tax=Embleya sp. NBC_00896 TaxID=2975961 RepID=UPI003868CCC2|nr:SigE family RNA polymerase sigma factor [Embleya sp. NBC_00896]
MPAFGDDRPAGANTEAVKPRRSRFRVLRGGDDNPPKRPTLTELYHAQRLGMVRLSILLVDDLGTAEDVVQDAFAALYSNFGENLDDVDNAMAYLRTSVVNLSRSVLRRRRTARAYVPPHEPDASSPEEAAVLSDEHMRVLAALKRLAPRQREVLVLRYWSELSETQMADVLGLSRGTIKSTASRALDALEKIMKDEQP